MYVLINNAKHIWLAALLLFLTHPAWTQDEPLPGFVYFKVKDHPVGQVTLPPDLEARLLSDGFSSFGPAFPMAPSANTRPMPGLPAARLDDIFVLRFDPEVDPELVAKYLEAQPEIDYAEARYPAKTFFQPNDPLADTTGSLNGQWYLSQCRIREAWDIERNDTSVIIGVIDSGISFDHPDLKDNLYINQLEPIDGLDNDLDGYVDNRFGWDFGGSFIGGPGDNDPSDFGHGVGVTGTFGATADNGIGTAGVCFNCRYLPIKAAADNSPNFISFGYEGILYAALKGAQIINCSWGDKRNSDVNQAIISYVTSNLGSVVIAACGNSQRDEVFYPAGYDLVFSVANSTYGDTLCCNSTYHHTVDMSAPGFRITAPVGKDRYQSLGGTSYSSPLVSGVVALVKSHFPWMNSFQAAERVRVTCDDMETINPDRIGKMGNGRVNALRALTDPPKPAIRMVREDIPLYNPDLNYMPGDTIVLDPFFWNLLQAAENLEVSYSMFEDVGNYIEVLTAPQDFGQVGTFNVVRGPEPIRLRISEDAPLNYKGLLKIDYRDTATNYTDFEFFEFLVNPSYINIEENDLFLTVTSVGNLGYADPLNQTLGIGASFRTYPSSLGSGGFLIGKSLNEVSDAIKAGLGFSRDLEAVNPIHLDAPEPAIPYSTQSTFRDNRARIPLEVTVNFKAYAWDNPDAQDFIILRYRVRNNNFDTLRNVYAGMFADWKITPLISLVNNRIVYRNASSYQEENKLVYAYDLTRRDPFYYGLGLLTEETFHAKAVVNNQGFSYTDFEKYRALTTQPNPINSTAGLMDGADIAHFASGGPFDIPPQGIHELAFVVLASEDLNKLGQISRTAKRYYRCIIQGEGPLADFSISDEQPVSGQALAFSDNNPATNFWAWDFGDGTTAQGKTAFHQYVNPGSYPVTLTVRDTSCQVVISRKVLVDKATIETSLDDGPKLSLRVFPNPGTGSVRLVVQNAPSGKGRWQLRDLKGRLLEGNTFLTSGGNWQKDLSLDLPAGVYLLQVSIGPKSETSRLIITP